MMCEEGASDEETLQHAEKFMKSSLTDERRKNKKKKGTKNLHSQT